MRWLRWLSVLVVLVGACSSGTDAPPAHSSGTACAEQFCVAYPDGWDVLDEGGSFLSFQHPAAPEDARASVSTVNLKGSMEAFGGSWPASLQEVVEAFWASIDEGNAELGRLEFRSDGAVESFGVFQSGRMWVLMMPTDATRAIGIEVRGPNASWEPHARVFLDGLQLLE